MMFPSRTIAATRAAWLILGLVAAGTGAEATRAARADEPATPEGRYARLLAKAPEARVGAIIEVIGRRGDAADLAYLLGRAIVPTAEAGGFAPPARRLALAALGEAAGRDARPTGDLAAIVGLLAPDSAIDPPTCAEAARVAGLWRVGAAVPALASQAEAAEAGPLVRDAALEALARINDEPSRSALVRLASPTAPPDLQRRALAALARVDLARATERVADLATGATRSDLGPVLAPILDQPGGAERLAVALEQRSLTPEAARALLAAVQGLGRSDPALVGPLARRAGVETAALGVGADDLARYNVEVARDGDPARGEAVFRRAALNCQKCHALNGAAGGVGPELTSLGLSSPVDYIVRSILEPDESIKEEYQTRIVSLDDGRVIQGIVVAEDDRQVVLKDANGDRREVPTARIEESRRGGSLMPKGLVNGLPRGEFLDLCRFLSELGRPGRYAIRSVPTIQRWRAAGVTPLLTADAVPTTASVPEMTWVPLYGWFDGTLPTREAETAVGAPTALIEGELAVTTPGQIRLRLEPSGAGALFFNGRRRVVDSQGATVVAVEPGTQRLTVWVDRRDDRQRDAAIRVELSRPGESPADFSVVGGR